MNKKAQGLPLEVIVIAAIAVLVLLLIIIFATGSFGGLFAKTNTIVQGTSDEQITVAQSKCARLCTQIQSTSSREVLKFSGYCSRTFPIDTNADGTPEQIYCWNNPIFDACTVTIGGDTLTVRELECGIGV